MRVARALLVSTATTAAVLTGSAAAQAAPVPDSSIYCGPGFRADGGRCEEVPRWDHTGPTLGEVVLGVGGLLALVVLW